MPHINVSIFPSHNKYPKSNSPEILNCKQGETRVHDLGGIPKRNIHRYQIKKQNIQTDIKICLYLFEPLYPSQKEQGTHIKK